MMKVPLPVTREDFPAYLNAVGLVGVAVEVGVEGGLFSDHILRHWKGARLIAVDPWEYQVGWQDSPNVGQAEQDQRYAAVVTRLAPYGARADIRRAYSVATAYRVPDGSLDFAYLDARHDEASVAEDIAAWWPKVRIGGILAGHDYTPPTEFARNGRTLIEYGAHRAVVVVATGHLVYCHPGVARAVDAFAARERVTVQVTLGDCPASWWVEKP